MTKLSKGGLGLILLAVLLVPAWPVTGAEEAGIVHLFVREGCTHCRDAGDFLDELTREQPQIRVQYYDLADEDNWQLFEQVTNTYELQKATPIALIRGTLMVGFDSAETTGERWRELLVEEGNNVSFADIAAGGARVASVLSASVCSEMEPCPVDEPLMISLPLIGTVIDVGSFSLPVLSAVLGLIDGFNPCAMWVLVMLLLLLSQARSRKRMWQFAGLFILAQGIMYYLILMVWLLVWDFVALDNIVMPLIAFMAMGSGGYFLYKWWTFVPVCSVAGEEQKAKIEERAKKLVSKPLTLLVALGIIGLAFSVNIFEFACSIGIPQVFTKILDVNQLAWWGRQFYVGLYMAAYILDDVIVFALALYSFDKIGLTGKYSKWTTLIGGILMVILGLLMLFKPGWLVF
ncbi:MAG: glutaredoxin [bacterium]